MRNAESPIGKFKILCRVKADLSKVPYTTDYATMGREREYRVVLFAGLTELKTQVCWIDLSTVRVYLFPNAFAYLIRFPRVRA